VWVDRSGKEIAKVGEADNAVLTPSMSPDEHHVAITRVANGRPDIYLMETVRGGLT
jgi:Tol biopolymer transport system component